MPLKAFLFVLSFTASCQMVQSFTPSLYDIRFCARISLHNSCFVCKATIDDTQSQTPQRRRKKNKYEKFSKVEDTTADPLERLIKESEAKLKVLENRQKVEQDEKRGPRIVIDSPGKLDFPNNKDIDPYDPTTFGYIEIGSISGPHGVYGWLKLKSTTDFAESRLCTSGLRHLRPAKKRAPRPVILVEGKHRHEDEYLIKLQDIDDRDEAVKLRGSVLYVRQEDKIETDQEEYIISDLVGLEVFLQPESSDSTNPDNTTNVADSQLFVGRVNGVVLAEEMSSVAGLGHDMLEIALPRGRNGIASFRDELVLVPLVPQIVPKVDIANKQIYIDPPNGLLDLTYVREERVLVKGLLPPARSV